MGKIDPKVAPFINIAERLGSFCMQLVDGPVKKIEVEVHGEIASMDTRMITTSTLVGVLANVKGENTNIINVGSIARDMGIQVVESKVDESTHYTNMLVIRVSSDGHKHEVRGTAYPGTEARILGVDEFDIDMPLEGDFIMTRHQDMPGMIGKVGTLLGDMKINIARMGVGREDQKGGALMLIQVDNDVDKAVLDKLRSMPNFKEARSVRLSHMKKKELMEL